MNSNTDFRIQVYESTSLATIQTQVNNFCNSLGLKPVISVAIFVTRNTSIQRVYTATIVYQNR